MNQFHVKPDQHGRCKWRVEGVLNGKRKRAFFKTKELAERAAAKCNKEVERHGHELTDMPGRLRAVALAQLNRLGLFGDCGAHLIKAVDEYLAHHDLRAKSVPVAQAYADYLANEEKRVLGQVSGKRLRAKSLESVKKIRRFSDAFAAEQLCDLTTDRIRDWIDALTCENGEPYSIKSKQTLRLSLSGFFSHCITRKWIGEHPIIGKIKAYRDSEEKQPGIFTVKEAARLLEAADAEILPAIAIGLFAGLRPTEVWRLNWEDIIWHKSAIDVKPGKSKTARYRVVPMPANLVEWLAPYRTATGRLFNQSQSTLGRKLSAAAKAAGIAEWPVDGLRHSYGSYHLADTDNAPLTAARMGHEDTKMLFKHYNNRRNPEEGKAYFQIRPLGADTAEQILVAAA